MATIIWTSEAERWLKDIYDYISLDNPESSASVVSGIYTKAQRFQTQPRIGYLYEHELEGEIRILLYGHYRITYQILANNDVFILGVFHGATEIENYLIT